MESSDSTLGLDTDRKPRWDLPDVHLVGAGFDSNFTATLGWRSFESSGTFIEQEPCEKGQSEIYLTRGTVEIDGSVTGISGPP